MPGQQTLVEKLEYVARAVQANSEYEITVPDVEGLRTHLSTLKDAENAIKPLLMDFLTAYYAQQGRPLPKPEYLGEEDVENFHVTLGQADIARIYNMKMPHLSTDTHTLH